jgi:outer membrane protein assembly factor BamE (lipoprotein component of BamABCDE complex)
MRVAVIVLIAASALFAGGCASSSYGTKLDNNKVTQIQKGVTTRAQVEQMFGSPVNISLMGDGRRTMMYSYTESNTHADGTNFIPVYNMFHHSASGTTHNQQLQVILTKADIVEDYVFNDGTNNVNYNSGIGQTSVSSTPQGKAAQ